MRMRLKLLPEEEFDTDYHLISAIESLNVNDKCSEHEMTIYGKAKAVIKATVSSSIQNIADDDDWFIDSRASYHIP